jgi:AcrR family transcriptional regulator
MTRKQRKSDGPQIGTSDVGPPEGATVAVTADRPADPPADPPAGQGYTIVELAALSGVGVPSIHHYRRKGLLPPPLSTESKRFLFGSGHVEALRLIRLLRTRWGFSLDTIAELLPELLATDRSGPLTDEEWDRLLKSSRVRSDPTLPMARLLVAARERFAQDGYEVASVAQICHDAGIAKGSFYVYFKSKHDLFLAAVLSTVDAVGDRLDTIDVPMSEGKAERELAALLKPFVPLYLEVILRDLRGETEATGLALGITEGIAGRLSPHLMARGQSTLKAGHRVASAAWIRLLRPALGLRQIGD